MLSSLQRQDIANVRETSTECSRPERYSILFPPTIELEIFRQWRARKSEPPMIETTKVHHLVGYNDRDHRMVHHWQYYDDRDPQGYIIPKTVSHR